MCSLSLWLSGSQEKTPVVGVTYSTQVLEEIPNSLMVRLVTIVTKETF